MNIQPALLSALGLTTTESQLYLAALELGEASVQELARKSGIKRTSIYNFIDSLKKRGIILEMKRKKRSVYSAAHPEQLLEIGRSKLKDFERLVPELLAINNNSLRKPRVTFYEGIDGIKEVYADMLEVHQPIVGWSDYKHMWATLGQEYCAYFPAERAKLGIPFHSIVSDSAESRAIAKGDTKVLRETKFLPSSDLKTEINIYGNKVLLAGFRSSPAFAVLIEDKDMSETLRIAWRELWKRL